MTAPAMTSSTLESIAMTLDSFERLSAINAVTALPMLVKMKPYSASTTEKLR
jgi:hypothetical protein